MGATRVTIVVATWNRPEVLSAAVRAARAQTVRDWRMIVVGDGCDARTGAALRAFDDDRIAYVNLTRRFGEQAGPNSIGMALADTPAIALLNHDDLWLPDHLERGLAALEGPVDVHVAAAARANRAEGGEAVFDTRSKPSRGMTDAFRSGRDAVEPASAWVFRTELVARVGTWRPSRELHRTPIEDWLLRAWRAGARIRFDPTVTVLNLITHYRRPRDDGNYATPSPEHEALAARLEREPAEHVRTAIARTTRAPGARFRLRRALLLNAVTAGLFRLTGRDAHGLYCRLSGRRRGEVLEKASLRRTGAALPPPPDRDAALAEARRALAGSGA